MIPVVGVRFKEAGKMYYFDPAHYEIEKNDRVIVETVRGVEYGHVITDILQINEKELVSPLKPVLRIADETDTYVHEQNKEKALRAMEIAAEKISQHGLPMKLIDAEYTFDSNKVIFYFSAENRVDFRELVKDLAAVFRIRIELKQIGVRDQAKMIGGLGPCGKETCCVQFMGEFEPVSIKMAKDQSISLNPGKISGLCGRLMCCLKFEQCVYEDKLTRIPRQGTVVVTKDGTGPIISTETLSETVRVKVELDDGTEEVRTYPIAECEITRQVDRRYRDNNEVSRFQYPKE